jgi:lipoprotein signal peptidase
MTEPMSRVQRPGEGRPSDAAAPAAGADQGQDRADAASTGPGLSAGWHLPSHVRLWAFAVVCLGLDLWTKHLAFTRLSLDPNDPHGEMIHNVMSFRRSLNPGALFGLGKGLVPIFIVASILALGFVLYLFAHSTRDRRSLHIALGLVLAGALGNLYDRAFATADVIKEQVVYARSGAAQTVYHAGTIIAETPQQITMVEGLLHKPEGNELARLRAHATHIRRGPNLIDVRRQGVVRDFIKMEPTIGSIHIWPWVFNLADSWLVMGVGLLLLNFWWDRRAERAAGGLESA